MPKTKTPTAGAIALRQAAAELDRQADALRRRADLLDGASAAGVKPTRAKKVKAKKAKKRVAKKAARKTKAARPTRRTAKQARPTRRGR